jgi:hypothetical protein
LLTTRLPDRNGLGLLIPVHLAIINGWFTIMYGLRCVVWIVFGVFRLDELLPSNRGWA